MRIGPGQMPVFDHPPAARSGRQRHRHLRRVPAGPGPPGGCRSGHRPGDRGLRRAAVGLGGPSRCSVLDRGEAPPCLTHLRRRPSRAKPPLSNADEGLPAAAFVASMVASVGLFVVYWQGGQTQLEGLLLVVVLGGIGAGIVVWAKRFMPHGPFEEHGARSRPTRPTSTPSSTTSRRAPRASPGGASWPSWPPAPSAGLGLAAHVPHPLARAAPGQRPEGDAVQGGGLRLVDEHGLPIRGRAARRRRRDHGVPRGAHRRRRRPDAAHPPPAGRQPTQGGPGGLRRRATSWRTPSCAPTSAARSGCTRPASGCCCARATSPPSTCRRAASRSSGPASRSLPQLPIAGDRRGLPDRDRRLQRSRRSRLLGPGARLMPFAEAPPRPPAGQVDRRADRRGQGRAQGPRQDLPRPLVVHAGRDRPLLLRHPGRHGRLPDVLLRSRARRPRCTSGSYEPLQGVEMSQAYESAIRLIFDVRAGLVMRQAHHWAALLFLGRDRGAPAAGVPHRRVPPAPGDQLGHRPDDDDPGHDQRVLRLLAARRPAVGFGAAHRVRRRAVDPGHRHVDRLAVLRRRVPRRRPLPALLRRCTS